MPTYQYACTACGHRFEAVQSFSDASLSDCPECAGRLRKVFSSVGIVFKGSGFYRTDSRANSGDKGESPGSSDSSGKDSGSKDGAGKDGGSAAGKETAAKKSDSGSTSSTSSTSSGSSGSSTSKSTAPASA